jgi:hypothetical protein
MDTEILKVFFYVVRCAVVSGSKTLYEYIYIYIVLFEMIDGVLITCHTQYTSDSSILIFFIFNRTTLQVLLHTLQVRYMCTICDTININTIIEFVPTLFVAWQHTVI